MSKTKITKTTNSLVLLTLAMYLIPVLVLSGFGIYAIWINDLFIHIISILVVLSFVLFLLKTKLEKSLTKDLRITNQERELAEASSDWSAKEIKMWEKSFDLIDDLLLKDDEWSALKPHTLEVSKFIALQYGAKEFDITIPETLKAIEEVSRRFRKTVKQNLPAQEYLKISHFKWGYEIYDGYADSLGKVYSTGSIVWRVGRSVANPLQSMISEIKDIW